MKQLIYSLFSLALLAGCAAAPQSDLLLQQTPAAFQQPMSIADVPFFPQQAYQCGPAALATMLGASQLEVNPDDLVPLVYVPERQGSFQVEMVAAARSFGRLTYQIPPTLDALLTEVNAGNPVLVMQNLGLNWYPQWHFAVVKGHDLNRRVLVLNSAMTEDYRLALSTFERTWARADHWAVVIVEPGQIPATAEADRYFSAAVALETNNPPSVAAAAYLAGIEHWPGDSRLLMAYGNLLFAEGDKEAAALQYRLTISHNPDYAPAYNNLATILLEQGELTEAKANVERAVALGGDFLESYLRTQERVRQALSQGH